MELIKGFLKVLAYIVVTASFVVAAFWTIAIASAFILSTFNVGYLLAGYIFFRLLK